MSLEASRYSAAINLLFWAVLVGLLMQAGALFLLRQANAGHASDTETINHLFNFINL